MKLFEFLNSMTFRKDDLDFTNDEIKKSYIPFMINRWISMCEAYLPVVNEINKYDLPKEIHYEFFKSLLPKRKQYFNYIKKQKDLDITEKRIIAKYFQVGLKEAEEYIKILDNSQIKEILEIYRYGKNSLIDE